MDFNWISIVLIRFDPTFCTNAFNVTMEVIFAIMVQVRHARAATESGRPVTSSSAPWTARHLGTEVLGVVPVLGSGRRGIILGLLGTGSCS